MKKIVNVVSFIALIALGRYWIEIDQDFLPQHLLFPAFIVVMLFLMTVYFFIVRPAKAYRLAKLLSLILVPIAIALTLYQHMYLHHDFHFVWKKSLLIWGICAALPFAGALVYSLLVLGKKSVS